MPSEAFLLLVFAAMACSTPQPMSTRSIEDYPFRQRQAAIRIGVDPLFRPEQVKASFPELTSMAEHGVLPIRVQVENGGAEDVQVAQADIVLTTAKGSRNVALTPEDAAGLLKSGAGVWRFVPIPIVSQSAMAVQNTQQEKELKARALPMVAIKAGGSASGFVYFYFAGTDQVLTGSQLEVKVTSVSGDTTFTFPLRGRRDILGPSAPPEKSSAPAAAPARQEGSAGQGVIIRSPAQ